MFHSSEFLLSIYGFTLSNASNHYLQKKKIVVKISIIVVLSAVVLSCKTTTYYISRHGEKAGGGGSDPSLTPEGERQAAALGDYLKGKNIGAVYSTNYLRTKATAKPTADEHHLPVRLYGATASGALVDSLKAANKKNVLIVGHSNTVDDLVNRFVGTNAVTDLPDSEYGTLFVVRKKKGGYSFEKVKVERR